MRTDKRLSPKPDKKAASRIHKRGIVGYSKKSALLEEAITHMNSGKYGRSSAALKELLALDPQNIEARRLFATLHLKLGSLVTARQAFESLANEAIGRQDYWLAESLLREYLAAGPRCVPFLEQLAQVHQEKGDEMAAVVELGKAIEILRDDPDPDHPQKAAQLYSKIRELAPASSVAFQLAPLFDVQTGEFLVRPSAAIAPPAEDLPADSSALTEAAPAPAMSEHPLPEVMPWELTDEPSAVLSQQTKREPSLIEVEPSLADDEPSSPDGVLEASDLAPTSQSDQSAEFLEASLTETEPEPVQGQEPVAFEPPLDEPVLGVASNESAFAPPSGIPSPMPWEEMADASVQIPEPESPPAPDAGSSLESVLASLRTQDTTVAPPIEARAADPFDGAQPSVNGAQPVADSMPPVELAPLHVAETVSPPLPPPMPWEEISDPSIHIRVPEPEPAPPSPVSPYAGIPTQVPEAAAEVQAPHDESAAFTTLEPAPEASPSPAGPAEVAQAPSFSWNSVFDKAWNFTAGTMAPSPTMPVPERPEPSDDAPPAVAERTSETTSMAEPAAAPQPVHEQAFASPVTETPVSPSVLEKAPVADPVSAQPIEAPPTPSAAVEVQEVPAHWNTGEVAVQVHRPSQKKKRWDKEPEEVQQSELPPEPMREWKTVDRPVEPVKPPDAPPTDERPDWMQATDAISVAGTEPSPSPSPLAWSDGAVAVEAGGESARTSTAAMSAVDVLFASDVMSDDSPPHRTSSWSKPRPRLMARVHRVRIGILSFIGSCFSTTRSLTFLAVMITIATALVACAGLGAVAVMWITLEEPPTSLYQSLTVSPPRIITDPKKNGYLFLMGFDAPDREDPTQVGYERKAQPERDRSALQVCSGDEMRMPAATGGASDQMVKGWIRSGDLPAAVKGQGGTLKSLTSRESTGLARYQQWLTMPFDDWGFGQSFAPNCPRVLLTHRLYLLEGFSQDTSAGLERLEADVQAWRGVLAQAKTLPVKMLALSAVQDDAAVASGLLSRQELDGAALSRLSKMVRPLDQVELSIRWPMQSQFVSATKAVPAELREDKAEDRPWHASLAAAMRLPVQRRANAYAEYYDAANKAVAGARYTNLPKASAFVRRPPIALTDYLVNPVEHIVGIEPLPSWDPYVYRVIETDAQLRLAGLQAWLRRGPQDGEILMRLAKAGQAFYDPFTGLPMLVNLRKGVIYSVGRDGKDEEGDALRDVTATIPTPTAFESRRTPTAAR